MDWKRKCFAALNEAQLFENSGHQSRFKELLDCYSGYPFFTKGLCKCMYLSAWDDEHFFIMLETLADLSLGKERNTDEMRIKGDAYVEEQADDQSFVYQLSNAFLDDIPFVFDEAAVADPGIRYIIDRALKASSIIDAV